MANELRETLAVNVTAADGHNLKFSDTRQADQTDTSPAIDTRKITVTTSDTALSFSHVTTEGTFLIKNLEAVGGNVVRYGPEDTGALVDFGEIRPQEVHKIRLAPSVTFRWQAITDSVDVEIWKIDG